MNKKSYKFLLASAVVMAAAIALASLAGAQTSSSTPSAPLAVSCSGVVSGNTVSWTAAASGGVPPYAYLWSGANVSGTSTTVVATYSAPGTYSASVQVNDSASSMVSASCSATINPAPQETEHQFFQQPMLNINPSGRFMARGMTVQSVGSSSFIGKVWGITYTVDVSAFPEFLQRKGRGLGQFSVGQLQVGDEVGVMGRVDASNPFVVQAQVVRDYSIISRRVENAQGEGGNENENHGHFFMPASGTQNSPAIQDIQEKLQELWQRVNELRGGRGQEHSVILPRRGPDGGVLRDLRDQLQSSNWSGYAAPSFATGKQYTSAAGTWTVPAVASAPAGYSSSWVGIGGFCTNASCTRVDHTLIQLGTEQDVNSSGAATYYAWYEMLPNPEVPIAGFTVQPGDNVTASLKLVSSGKSGQVWQLSMTDNATKQTWSQQFSYKSSLASAEWIEEAPYSAGILPLADYGTATFDPGTVNGGQNPGLAPSEGIIMYDPNGQTSNPSAPDTDTDGFNTCWGSSSLTACSAPSS